MMGEQSETKGSKDSAGLASKCPLYMEAQTTKQKSDDADRGDKSIVFEAERMDGHEAFVDSLFGTEKDSDASVLVESDLELFDFLLAERRERLTVNQGYVVAGLVFESSLVRPPVATTGVMTFGLRRIYGVAERI